MARVERPPSSLLSWAGAGHHKTGLSAGIGGRETRLDLSDQNEVPPDFSVGNPDPEWLPVLFQNENCEKYTHVPYPYKIDGTEGIMPPYAAAGLQWAKVTDAWNWYFVQGSYLYDNFRGIVTVFRTSESTKEPYLTLYGEEGEGFGIQVAIYDGKIAVGCARAINEELSDDFYAVKLFNFEGELLSSVSLRKKTRPPLFDFHGFGPGPIVMNSNYIFVGDPLFSRVRVYDQNFNEVATLSGGNLNFGLGTSLAISDQGHLVSGNPCVGEASVTFWDCSTGNPSTWQDTSLVINKPSAPYTTQRNVSLNNYETDFGFSVAVTDKYIFVADGKGGLVDAFDHNGTLLSTYYNHNYNQDLSTGPSLDAQVINKVTQLVIGGSVIESYIFDGTEFTNLCTVPVPTTVPTKTKSYDITSVGQRNLSANTYFFYGLSEDENDWEGERAIYITGQPGSLPTNRRDLYTTNNINLEGNRIYVGSPTTDINGINQIGEAFIIGVTLTI